MLRQRMIRCEQAYRQHVPLQRRPATMQRGDCDISDALDLVDLCDCLSGCNGRNWPKRKEKKDKRSSKP